ncbi:hypothetical protein DPMN_096953 [Dreissena polymorpha]|uniref:Uncharacterized protein n=1 Tax=Dreissena polymorpha TaxID=45954 RepID=A0A9D4LCC9_DREPO|nr:hypothetical protein DPMN_096953 [Dreissena polymorpha]
MAAVEEKVTKKRSANFSTADCLLLAEIMGSESGMEGLAFHAYTKHRFTNSVRPPLSAPQQARHQARGVTHPAYGCDCLASHGQCCRKGCLPQRSRTPGHLHSMRPPSDNPTGRICQVQL